MIRVGGVAAVDADEFLDIEQEFEICLTGFPYEGGHEASA